MNGNNGENPHVVRPTPPSPPSDEECVPPSPSPVTVQPEETSRSVMLRARRQCLTDDATRDNHRFEGTLVDYEVFRRNPDKPNAPLGKFIIEYKNDQGLMLWNECVVFSEDKAKYAANIPMKVGFTMQPSRKTLGSRVVGEFWPLQ